MDAAPQIPEIIRIKRDGGVLKDADIEFFVQGVAKGTIQDSQIGAMLMAIRLQGMNASETVVLTRAMLSSGERLPWPKEWHGLVVDKHSTGGVGDKVSLSLAPALAACGCKVPMISGRGLAHTGGTLDKLESIPGFCVQQSQQQILHILETVGCCIVGQTESLVPADRILYGIRDVTSTVDSIPLVTGSIISKKACENLSALVLDVKFGKAAFYKSEASARELAISMVDVGTQCGIRTIAVLSKMDNPIGLRVGNSLEVMESVECMQGKGPADLVQLVTKQGGVLLNAIGKVGSAEEGEERIRSVLLDGSALVKFEAMLTAQGVEAGVARRLCRDSDFSGTMKPAKYSTDLSVDQDGFVQSIDAMGLAIVLQKLGMGRSQVGDPVNHSVGVQILAPVGHRISRGEKWIRVFHEEAELAGEHVAALQESLDIGPVPCAPITLVTDIITASS
ncbi:thymidine phosphorylase isoform X1 [Lampetra fluviatilis]